MTLPVNNVTTSFKPGQRVQDIVKVLLRYYIYFLSCLWMALSIACSKVPLLYDIDKQELVLELDFFATEGSAPALREPPEFKVGITKRYFEGDRPEEPDWFYKGTEVYEKNVTS